MGYSGHTEKTPNTEDPQLTRTKAETKKRTQTEGSTEEEGVKMKFRFCGGLDAPTWLLTEMVVLSKLNAAHTQAIAEEVVRQLLGDQLNFKVAQSSAAECGLSGESDLKAAIAAFHFVFTNAVKHDVAGKSLLVELQQLGLPHLNAGVVMKIFDVAREAATEKFRAESFQLPRMEKMDWRVDYLLASSHVKGLHQPSVQLKFDLSHSLSAPYMDRERDYGNARNTVAFEMSGRKFDVLYSELKSAYTQMKALE